METDAERMPNAITGAICGAWNPAGNPLYSMMAVDLVIFDLDGTLIDSIRDITNAVNYTFEPFGIDGLSPSVVAGMIGEGAYELIRRVCQTYDLTLDIDPLVERYTGRYASHPTDCTVLYPDVTRTLSALDGCRKAIISNKSEYLSLKILDRFGLLPYFDMVVCADTLPERKPSPAPVFHVLSALRCLPRTTVIVGDSEVDVMTGRASGVKSVAVTHGYGAPGFEKYADFVIDSLLPLPDLLAEIG